jgi:broad specificity phosphatase PhoE
VQTDLTRSFAARNRYNLEETMSATFSATKVMLIRHAEKPTSTASGINIDGAPDSSSLIPQGWQRAGALNGLFTSAIGPLPTPQFLFAPNLFGKSKASNAKKHSSSGTSRRPYETITPLSQKLGITINAIPGSKNPAQYAKGDYPAMLTAALALQGIVLIAWEHGEIPNIANQILGNKTTAPQKWPSERFDMVWVFDLNTATNAYSFNQAPQLLLQGDLTVPIF